MSYIKKKTKTFLESDAVSWTLAGVFLLSVMLIEQFYC